MDKPELGQGHEAQGQVLYLMNTKQRRLTRAKNSCLAVEELLNSKQDLINNLLWMCNWQYHSASPCSCRAHLCGDISAWSILQSLLQPSSVYGTAVPDWKINAYHNSCCYLWACYVLWKKTFILAWYLSMVIYVSYLHPCALNSCIYSIGSPWTTSTVRTSKLLFSCFLFFIWVFPMNNSQYVNNLLVNIWNGKGFLLGYRIPW